MPSNIQLASYTIQLAVQCVNRCGNLIIRHKYKNCCFFGKDRSGYGEQFERQYLGHIESGVKIFETTGDVDVAFEVAE